MEKAQTLKGLAVQENRGWGLGSKKSGDRGGGG